MNHKVFQKNLRFYLGVALTVIEGILSGAYMIPLYVIMNMLWRQEIQMQELVQMTITLCLIYLFRLIIYGSGYTLTQIGGAKVSRQLRCYLGDKMKRIPLSKLTKGQMGQYINTMTSDVNNYEKVLTHTVGDIIKFISLALMLILFVGTLWFPGGLIMLVLACLEFPFMYVSFHIVHRYGSQKNAISAQCVSSIVEYATGLQTFRAYGIGGMRNTTITDAFCEYSKVSYEYEAHGIPINVIQNLCIWAGIPIMMAVAFPAVISGTLDSVSFLFICMLPMFQAKILDNLTRGLISYKNLMISKDNISALVEEQEEQGAFDLQPKHYDIEFENVSFAYIEDRPVLQHVSFRIPNQQLTAIVGDSGSGKSTILNLIAKYYVPYEGCIHIGDIDIRHIISEQVLSFISMVDQDTFLFHDTIRNNLRYAKSDATDEEIEAACKEANCHELILQMKHGYETFTGENGNRLSGGERQRISVARAILKNAPILLLDEATASLDIENEIAVKQAIINLLKKQKTVVMIAHTLSIVKNAAQILVVADGQIIEAGTHAALLAKRGKYAAMWEAEQKLLH